MASKLCCTAEEEGRSDSPELPNARVSAATPAARPLLPKPTVSLGSRFTSAQSDELHELRQIFNNAQDHAPATKPPQKGSRAGSSQPSIISLHSLHKMTSMRSIIRRKFSRDLSKKDKEALGPNPNGKKGDIMESATVVKHEEPNRQLRITKDDLRKDLLSDKRPAEGGYDSDAEVLDDIARNIGKKTPGKRPSIHSVEWSPSTARLVLCNPRFTQVFSTPNLRAEGVVERDRKLRRSHSATSMGLPKPSPISPLRLPSLTNHDQDGVPWSAVMSKSLRLSQFPLPPQHASLKSSETPADPDCNAGKTDTKANTEQIRSKTVQLRSQDAGLSTTTRTVEIRVQQPTSITSPRPSSSVRGGFRENEPCSKDGANKEAKDEEEDNPRRSVHLYSMRISHHLRSGSLLSSGFHSSKVPSKWGKVLTNERDLADVASSIYSSRPQSPPDSFGGSMVNLSRPATGYHTFSHSSVDVKKPRRSNSFPTDNEETPRPAQRYGITGMEAAQEVSIDTSLLAAPAPLARKNSVAETKKSKFREEFSPSPPKKKIAASTSIIKFLNPKRLSMRSLSDANLQSSPPEVAVDGVFDTLPVPANRERRHSRSTTSLQSEQEAHRKKKGANHVWDQALKTHQEEKASMFLPKNKSLAVHASPFRERSGSFSGRRPSEAVAMLFETQGDSPAVVGAWGRYPSHTRVERTLSVSKTDRVKTRDFALEAAIRFASARDNDYDEDMVDPIECTPSPPLLPGEKKRKKKVGSGKMAKSHSMTFGRKLIKNYYSGIFKSSSSEFRQHGRGHRSSIASGGTLEHPELELLPEVFMSGGTDGASDGRQHRSDKQVVRRHSERHKDAKTSGELPVGDSMATLRPRRNSSAPNLSEAMMLHDGAGDADHDHDRARVWSVYYGTCIPSFPRASTDLGLEEYGGRSHKSMESKRASLRSDMMTTSSAKHSRNASQMSRMSRASARPSFVSMADDEAMGEEQSVVSVRRSTMDLISRFKEQEATEHERVMSLTRAESSHMRAL
ncbi:hypothetical protein BKA63DRAFT_402272 [Paraphoma chrysanthemicola]|nr:hypothetical protein BKA63DRAFT_402272 [Paraphoma chrysanthemicola]